MIKLSNYLDYLYKEVIQARKTVDEQSVLLAKEYAKDEYLKFFRVPRFTMPSVKLEIPLKIDEIDAETKYKFKMEEATFIKEVNGQIKKVNKEKNLRIEPITKKKLEERNFYNILKEIERRDYKGRKNLDDSINKIDFKKKTRRMENEDNSEFLTSNQEEELNTILRNAIKDQFKPVSARLNNIFIDPDTTKASDKEKLFVNLNVELVEEGLRIVTLKDENGNEFEEIVFE